MEIMYPIVIIITLVIVVAIFLIKPKGKKGYTEGKKVANTNFVKETEYYKNKVKAYKRLSTLIKILYTMCIIISSILLARIVKVQTKSEEKYNRDIMLSIDLSASQDEVNLELIRKFRKIIPNIEGDRVGIIIFNTAPIVYCPLTEDYDYIDESLETLEKQLKVVIENNGEMPYDPQDYSAQMLFEGGVIAGNETKGSSLVGDGLAGTIYSFPDVKTNKDRTRIIIFATDNSVAGKETITLAEACKLCKQYNINLYAYCPTIEMNEYVTTESIREYRNAVEGIANGKFYTGNLSKMTSSIIDEVETTKKTLLKTNKKTYATDYPQIPFIGIIISFAVLLIIEKRIKI